MLYRMKLRHICRMPECPGMPGDVITVGAKIRDIFLSGNGAIEVGQVSEPPESVRTPDDDTSGSIGDKPRRGKAAS